MVRVSTGLCRYLPCLIPSKSFLIQKDTHQLCNCYRRMGIVELEGSLLIKLADIAVCLLIFFHCCLNTRRNEEILLLQTKLLACIVVVIRVKNVNDILCKVLLLNRLLIITLIEGIQMEVRDRLCIPYTQGIYYVVIVSKDRHIKRYGTYRLISFLDKVVFLLLFIVLNAHIAAEFYDLCILRTAKLERIAILEPVIRYFYLIAVLNFLLEHSVAVTDTAAVCRITKGCQRIQEACCQTAKSAVSKCCIRLLILDHVEVKAHLIECFLYFLICTQIDQVVSERTAHQEFHGHIIYGLRIIHLILLLGCQPVVNDSIFYCIRYGLEQLLLCCLIDRFAIESFHVLLYTLFESFLVKCLTHHILPFLQTVVIGSCHIILILHQGRGVTASPRQVSRFLR